MTSRLRQAAAAALLCLLAACGGGESQVEPFEPRRLLAFGDELSMLTPVTGKRYGINGVKTVNELPVHDCTANPIWVQQVANAYGLVLAECNPDNATVTARLYGQLGAKVSDLRQQIDQHLATGGSVGPRDLITLMAGTHDILDLYLQYPAQNEVQLRAAAAARGRQMAEQANRLANANGRVIIATIPNVGLTPFALTEKANNAGVDRAALIRGLSEEFNRALRLNLINDGRLIGLVLVDETVDLIATFPSGFGLANSTQAACGVALPDCATNTLVSEATSATWMWADSLRPGPVIHTQMGNLALERVSRLPF